MTTVTALCLSACGNDGKDTKTNDKITGAETGTKASASPSPSAADSAARPRITFPSYAKNVFEYEKTGNAVKDTVFSDSTLSINSVDDAVFQGSTGTKALGFYNTDKALSSQITYIQGYIDAGETWIGETTYRDWKVTLSGETKAYVSYCSDESKAFIENKKTKKVDRSPATSRSYVLYHSKLVRNAKGVWQTTDVVSNRGDKTCQP
nr:hypothetical protein [Streptomyces sp. SID4950]